MRALFHGGFIVRQKVLDAAALLPYIKGTETPTRKQQMITSTIGSNGKTYFTAVSRGVSYCAMEMGGDWFVASHRLALGSGQIGGGRYYKSLADVSQNCKAFSGLDLLLEAA